MPFTPMECEPSPSARREWIEIYKAAMKAATGGVSLREEGVD